VARVALIRYLAGRRINANMASRSKRRVKARSKAHKKWVKSKMKRRRMKHPKVGFGTKKRRAKKARKASKKK